MLILVRLISIIILGMGVTLLFSPKTLKQLIAFMGQKKRIYIVGILRLLFGTVFLLAASQCRRWHTFVATLGILMLIGGILIFILGSKRISSLLNWWSKRPLMVIRLLGLIPLTLGALLIYSA